MTQLEDAFIASPEPMDGFLYVAKEMLDGAAIIYKTTQEKSMAVTHLCGHSVETALKAVLSKCGLSVEELRSNQLGHDLECLWLRAIAEGVSLSELPEWLGQLNRVHSRPYSVRYPLYVHAVGLPNQQAMLTGCKDLLSCVDALCK
jgi:hypothetical protein